MTEPSETDSAEPITPDERDSLFRGLGPFPLALCVSGGADSMALMHLVAEWRDAGGHRPQYPVGNPDELPRRRHRRPERLPDVGWLAGVGAPEDLEAAGGPAPIVVLTVDHGLRPEAADEPLPTAGIQEWARNLRRRLILELLDAEAWRLFDLGFPLPRAIQRRVLMAHHLDDQAETVLMRLARGSGLRGLSGMRAVTSFEAGPTVERRYRIAAPGCRPLLSLPKSRLVSTLRAAGAGWREDTSNTNQHFERVRLRKAMRTLAGLGLGAPAIAQSAVRLCDAESSLDCFEVHWRRGILRDNGGLYGETGTPQLYERGRATAVRLLSDLMAGYGGAARPPDLVQVENLIDRLIDTPFTGATLGGCRIERVGTTGGGRLLIYREGNGEGLGPLPLGPGEEIEWDGGRFVVESDLAVSGPAEVRALGAAGWARLKREVDGLDELKLKAAAMATLPAIWRGEEIVSVPWLNAHLTQAAALPKAARNWTAWCGPEAHLFTAWFCGQIVLDPSGGQD